MNFKIILPTHVKYLDITNNFIELLRLNWPEAVNSIIVSLTGKYDGKKVVPSDIPVIFNEDNTTLPECIVNASEKYKADYYFVFLGDAFISKPVDTNLVTVMLAKLQDKNVNYCRLLPQLSRYKYKGEHKELFRTVNSNERYSHSFVAFVATNKFIQNEFSGNITDRQFEIKYLELANKKIGTKLNDRVVLNKNIFNILPSLQKGKWDRINIFYLKKKYPQIDFAHRDLISWKYEFIIKIRMLLLPMISDKLRLKLKRSNSKYFDTDL